MHSARTGAGLSASSRPVAAFATTQQMIPAHEVRQILGITTRTLERGLSAIGAPADAHSLSQREVSRLLDHLSIQADFWL